VLPEMFRQQYDNVWQKNAMWNDIRVAGGELFAWQEDSTYIKEPPFLVDLSPEPQPILPLAGARCLALLGDSVTTDHISPAGAIAADSPAGKYLQAAGVQPTDFNSYGSRRGNDQVMTRGTLANIRIRNQLAPATEGGVTRHLPDGAQMFIYDAAMQYRQEGVPLVILAGTEYGTGSSRDWAAKGTYLLGVRAVFASSYERIHRSNLVGMGVLPLEFADGSCWQSLGLTGEEIFEIPELGDNLQPRQTLTVVAKKSTTAGQKSGSTAEASATEITFQARVRIDTPVELDYYRNGGILQTVLRKLLKG
jgi:aconitate hydratase